MDPNLTVASSFLNPIQSILPSHNQRSCRCLCHRWHYGYWRLGYNTIIYILVQSNLEQKWSSNIPSMQFQKNVRDTLFHAKPWLSSVSSLLFSKSVKLALKSSTFNQDQTTQEPRPTLITVSLLPLFLPTLSNWYLSNKSSAILFSMYITSLERKTLTLTT